MKLKIKLGFIFITLLALTACADTNQTAVNEKFCTSFQVRLKSQRLKQFQLLLSYKKKKKFCQIVQKN